MRQKEVYPDGTQVDGGGSHETMILSDDAIVIPRVHPLVIKAIGLGAVPDHCNAVGVMEFFSITAAVYAADAAVKAAEVELIDLRLGTGIGGKSFAVVTGEVSAVREAIDAGVKLGSEKGLVVSSVVIPNPRPEVFTALL